MEIIGLFSTPIVVLELPGMEDLNRELAERLTAEARLVPSFRRSNVGGWHSRPDLSHRGEPCFRDLVQVVVHGVDAATRSIAGAESGDALANIRYAATAWAMVMQNGDYAALHDHGDAHWSSVYYVDAGDADEEAHPESGLISFVDPRRGAPAIPEFDLFASTVTFHPGAGTLLLFPGYLQHYVHPYRGHRPRVSISVNVTLAPLEPGADTLGPPVPVMNLA